MIISESRWYPHAGTWLATAWIPHCLCYCPPAFICHLCLTILSFLQGNIQRTFNKCYLNFLKLSSSCKIVIVCNCHQNLRISPILQATGTQYVSLLHGHWFKTLLFHAWVVKATTTMNMYSPSWHEHICAPWLDNFQVALKWLRISHITFTQMHTLNL